MYYVNENGWTKDKIISDWFFKIWLPHLKIENIFNEDISWLLILDKTTSHKIP